MHNVPHAVQRRFQEERLEYDQAAVLVCWWDLARLGVIALPGGSLGAGFSRPEVVLTDRGRTLLQCGEDSPDDPDNFLRRVRDRVPNPDEIALT